jgi:outer membrane protein OmpA-like peptidoglycan-associated protein
VTVTGCVGAPVCVPLPSETVFAMALGGGLDVKVRDHLALRLVQAEYLMTRFRDPSTIAGERAARHNIRLSTGIVFRFGGNPPPPPPNRPPVVTCSIDKATVNAGSGDTVVVRAQASDPDDDPLTYTWSATGGTVDGTGAEVRWNSAGVTAGNYTIKVRVDDGRGGSADCSASITVEPPPNRPPTMTCSVERTPIQPGERTRITATASDPDNDPLTYTWRASAGKLTGTGATVEFDSTGLAAGSYTITGRVEDGRGGAADCSTAVEVQAPPPAPQASKTNECNYRAASGRVDNVCKRVLDDVALRLKNEPKATVLLIGYSDPGEKRSAKLAQDRADQVKKYLTDKGVDAARINTRAATGEKGAGKTNQRVDIVWVPEGATY